MSREYMIEFIKNPEHPRFYGSGNDRMPAYGEEGTLTEQQIGLVVDWLLRRVVRAGRRADALVFEYFAGTTNEGPV